MSVNCDSLCGDATLSGLINELFGPVARFCQDNQARIHTSAPKTS